MGTSSTSKGPKISLVPSWVDEPASSPAATPEGDDGTDDSSQPSTNPTPYPNVPVVPSRASLQSARGDLTRGFRTSDAGAIHRGARKYVTAGGGGFATSRKMSNSRSVATGIANLARSYATSGPVETLRPFSLEDMAESPAEDVFVALIDFICPAGGSIEEAIARHAMIETISDFASTGVRSFDGLTTDELNEFFIGVVARSIEAKIFHDVGTNAISVPNTIAGVQNASDMLHDFVDRCVRDAFERRESNFPELESSDVQAFVDNLYSAALDLIAAFGEKQ